MVDSPYIYHHGQQELHGFLSLGPHMHQLRPAVLVVHDWSGCNEFALDQARMMNQLGYIGFAVDMFGEGKTGTTLDEKKALITPLMTNRLLIIERLKAALDTVSNLKEVDATNIAIIGFCFGGLCALDLARSGAEIKGAVSFHGLLNKPEDLSSKPIKAKVLALHGYDDPMVPPVEVNKFCEEMTEAHVDWQVHAYGNTQHAFTNPEAHDTTLGTVYNGRARQRAFQAMNNFLVEVFTPV